MAQSQAYLYLKAFCSKNKIKMLNPEQLSPSMFEVDAEMAENFRLFPLPKKQLSLKLLIPHLKAPHPAISPSNSPPPLVLGLSACIESLSFHFVLTVPPLTQSLTLPLYRSFPSDTAQDHFPSLVCHWKPFQS